MVFRALFVFIYLASFNVNAASYNCNQKLTKVESMVCNDQEASNLDHELSKKYNKKIRYASDERILRMKQDQRKWLKEKRNKCKNIECIRNSYMIRIYELMKYKPYSINHILRVGVGHFKYKEYYQTPNFIVPLFNNSKLNKTMSNFSECESSITIRDRNNWKRTSSYGALCTLIKGDEVQKVIVCENTDKETFKMKPTKSLKSISELAIFVVNNCHIKK